MIIGVHRTTILRNTLKTKIFNQITAQNYFNMGHFKNWITLQNLLRHSILIIVISLVLISLTSGKEVGVHRQEKQLNNHIAVERSKRAPNGEKSDETNGDTLDNFDGDDSEAETTPEPSGEGGGKGDKKKSEVSLGGILGICLLICTIIYCIGIGYKIFKIFKGTYVEEEPVFLKYK